jgi:hypothetical protein
MRPDLLPDTFYCLKCIVRLTGVDVEDKLKAIRNFLPGIAIMRRALWIGLTEGEVPDATQFSKRLGESLSWTMYRSGLIDGTTRFVS